MPFLYSSPDLQVLSIGLDLSKMEAGEVVCSLKTQGKTPDRESSWRVSTSDVGLPQRLDRRAERSGVYDFKMPGWVLEEIRSSLTARHPLWLHLERPAGYLAAVPWERIFQPALGVPVLRLPEVEAEPSRETPGVLDVLLCASAPAAKERFAVPDLLTAMADRILTEVPRRVHLHVFIDQGFHEVLRDRWGDRPGTLYDPGSAAAYSVPEAGERVPETQGQVQSPWLLWMRDSLRGRSVDVAHFLCHGYFSFERGALCFSESPLQNEDHFVARFVGAGELASFLTQVGAWSTAFSSPPGNFSEIGLRLLADTLPQVRPGPVLLHDLPRDRTCQALGEAYRFLYGPQPGLPPASPALALRCQPSRVEPPAAAEDSDGATEASAFAIGGDLPITAEAAPVREHAVGDLLGRVFTVEENVPSWIAAATRYVEQQTVRLKRAEAGSTARHAPTEERTDPVAETLRQIRDIVAQAAGSGAKP